MPNGLWGSLQSGRLSLAARPESRSRLSKVGTPGSPCENRRRFGKVGVGSSLGEGGRGLGRGGIAGTTGPVGRARCSNKGGPDPNPESLMICSDSGGGAALSSVLIQNESLFYVDQETRLIKKCDLIKEAGPQVVTPHFGFGFYSCFSPCSVARRALPARFCFCCF